MSYGGVILFSRPYTGSYAFHSLKISSLFTIYDRRTLFMIISGLLLSKFHLNFSWPVDTHNNWYIWQWNGDELAEIGTRTHITLYCEPNLHGTQIFHLLDLVIELSVCLTIVIRSLTKECVNDLIAFAVFSIIEVQKAFQLEHIQQNFEAASGKSWEKIYELAAEVAEKQ